MISIQNLYKNYEGKVIFKDFSMDIEDREFVIFAGVSGCGKTTLLNMIGGLEKPDRGSVTVDGTDIWKEKNKQWYFTYKVGFLFQNFALLEDRTALGNLKLVQKKARTGMTPEEALEAVGLSGKGDTKVYRLSGGEQQRVALARLMLKKCDIILADEPTGSLDDMNAQMVMELLHRMNDQGRTVIVVTHNERIKQQEKRVVDLGKIAAE